jgi:hypothetical protein
LVKYVPGKEDDLITNKHIGKEECQGQEANLGIVEDLDKEKDLGKEEGLGKKDFGQEEVLGDKKACR